MTPQSPLDKPLSKLTEDDISQLTREDCRRFLKEKGMRRPSWNKSQAIQQVISLKALLEVRSDPAGADIDRKPPPQAALSRGDTKDGGVGKGVGEGEPWVDVVEMGWLDLAGCGELPCGEAADTGANDDDHLLLYSVGCWRGRYRFPLSFSLCKMPCLCSI